MKYILAHDLGTSGNKATLFSDEGKMITSEVFRYDCHYFNTNWAEQDPEDFWKAICVTSRNLIDKARIDPGDIAAVSFSGQMMGCLCVDKQGNPLRPSIIWADQRAQAQAAALGDGLPVRRPTGSRYAYLAWEEDAGVLDALEALSPDGGHPVVRVDDPLRRRQYEHLPAGGLEGRTRAMLKVEDGCVNFCTYCIIPYARGPVRSLPLEEAVRQTEQLRREGYREVVFTGIEISSWGQDFKDGRNLIDLLEAVSQAAGEMRLRLGSLEPRTVTEDFCRRAARLPNLCPQFHLSMQSGCDATLRRMNRRYDTARFLRSVTLLRQYFPRPAITTDLICGFPGETEEEFSQTLAFLRRCDFAQMHIFPYSIRPGTKAAEMEQVPGPVKEERAARAAAVAAELHRAYLQGCVGQTYPVLFEQRKDGCAAGHAPNYMPVEVQTQEDYHNTVRHVKITGVVNDILMGEVT